ncbi:hypothetical protein D6783_06180 [Candidatus Woesearchaeota archaeon]|nr:MAG: hypothetical protein D6783_06180 [Candidatus Woesearchaeota archaeon]
MTVESELEVALKNSWSRETSSDPEHWTPDNPAWGQCAVTALVVNDYLGGEIVRADAILPDGRWVPHYFNRIENVERDFTRSQFPEGTTIPQGVPKLKGFSSTREYVLSNPMTRQRYEVLKQRVRAFLE